MKSKILLLLLLTALLAGCSGAAQATPEVLPTIVLGADVPGAAGTPAAPVSTGGVVASGNIIPAQEAKVSAILGGTVERVQSSVGSEIKKGQVIVSLGGKAQQQAAVEAARMELLTSQQALDTLKQEAELAKAQAQLRLAQASDAFNEATKKRGWKEYRIGDDNQVAVARADLIVAQDWLKRKQEMYGGWAESPEDNLNKASALSELSNAQKAVDRAQANLNYLMNKPDTYEVAIADANLEIARAELEVAQADFDKFTNGPDPDALALAETRVSQAQAQLEAAEYALQSLDIKAPFDGTLSKVFFQVGEWVQPGQPVVVVANLSSFQVETKDLSERNVAQVSVGQKVRVFIEALNQTAKGTVLEVAPLADTLGGDVVYRSLIVLDEAPEGLRAGMSAEVTFITE
jgi:HlyD family secretion protein